MLFHPDDDSFNIRAPDDSMIRFNRGGNHFVHYVRFVTTFVGTTIEYDAIPHDLRPRDHHSSGNRRAVLATETGQLSLTIAERKRAAIAKCLHESLGDPNNSYLALELAKGAYLRTEITADDYTDCALGKIFRSPSTATFLIKSNLGERIEFDILFFYGSRGSKIPHLQAIKNRVGHPNSLRLSSKTAENVITALRTIFAYYRGTRTYGEIWAVRPGSLFNRM
jgi:hypothetical protein